VAALDKLSIDTPEQVALDFSLASIGSRFLALAVDSLIQAGATVAILLLAGLAVLISGRSVEGAGAWALAVVILAWFLITQGYFAFFEAIWNGQTPGKRVIGLRVISVTGRPISVFEAILRNVVRIADQLPGIYAFGIISIFVTERNQRLGDLAAGTVVVHERAVEPEDRVSVDEDATAAVTMHGAARLAGEEISVLELFLRRRSQLGNYERLRMSRQLAARLRDRLGITAEMPHEQLIEEVMAEYRSRNRYR
jgi:uncharacterized RDD family membrane protein YckC